MRRSGGGFGRRHWRTSLLRSGRRREELVVTVSGELAVAHYFLRFTGLPGEPSWIRVTVVYKRVSRKWLIVHEHSSVPFDPETLRACVYRGVIENGKGARSVSGSARCACWTGEGARPHTACARYLGCPHHCSLKSSFPFVTSGRDSLPERNGFEVLRHDHLCLRGCDSNFFQERSQRRKRRFLRGLVR